MPDSSRVERVPYVDIVPDILDSLDIDIKTYLEEESTIKKIFLLLGEAGCGKTSFLHKIAENFSSSDRVSFVNTENVGEISRNHVYLIKDATADLENGLVHFNSLSSVFVIIGVNYSKISNDLKTEADELGFCVEQFDYGRQIAESLSDQQKFLELLRTIIVASFKCEECAEKINCTRAKVFTSVSENLDQRFYRHFIYWYLNERVTRLLSPSLIIEWILTTSDTFFESSGLRQSVRLNWKEIRVEDSFLNDKDFDLKLIGDPAFNEFLDIFTLLDSNQILALPVQLNDTVTNAIKHFIRKESNYQITTSLLRDEFYLGSILDILNSDKTTQSHLFIKQRWSLMAKKNYENFIIEIEFRSPNLPKPYPTMRLDYSLYRVIHRLSLGDIQINQDIDYLRHFLLSSFDAYTKNYNYLDSQHFLISIGLMKMHDSELYKRLLYSIRGRKKIDYKVLYPSRLAKKLVDNTSIFSNLEFYSPDLPNEGIITVTPKTFDFKEDKQSVAIDGEFNATPIVKSVQPQLARLREFCIAAYKLLGYNVRNPKGNNLRELIENASQGKSNWVIPYPWEWPEDSSPYLLGILIGWSRLFTEYHVAESLGSGWGLRNVETPRKFSDSPWFRTPIMSSATRTGYLNFLEDIGVITNSRLDETTISLSLLNALLTRVSIEKEKMPIEDFIEILEKKFCITMDQKYSRIDLVRRLSLLKSLQRGSDYDDFVLLRGVSR